MKYEQIGDERPLVKGSTGQETLHPILKEVGVLEERIAKLEAQFGLTPWSRLRLGLSAVESYRSLEQLDRDLDGQTLEDGEDDPRLPADNPRS